MAALLYTVCARASVVAIVSFLKWELDPSRGEAGLRERSRVRTM